MVHRCRPHQGIIFLTLSLKPQVFTDRKTQKNSGDDKTDLKGTLAY